MALFNLDRFVPDHHRRFGGLLAGECEVVGRRQSLGLVPLENVWQVLQKAANGSGTYAVIDRLGLLVGKSFHDMRLGIRTGDHVNRLGFLLEWLHDGLKERFAVVQEGADHIVAGRAHCHAVRGLVVRAEAEALPDGSWFRCR